MSNTVPLCQIDSCKKEAATKCYHCQQEVCHTHFAEHSSMIMTDVYSLADRINILTDDITTLSIAQTHNSLFSQLQQWRDEMFNLIENIYTQKQVELNAKISQVDTAISLANVEKQQEVSQIKTKITELINTGEATFDQVNRLRKSVDKIAFDVDQLRKPAIRIETQPANLNTCRIIYIDQVSHAKPEGVSESVSKIHINDDVRHSNRQTNRYDSSENQSMVTMNNSRAASSTPISGSIMTSDPLYVPHRSSTPLSTPIPVLFLTPVSSRIPTPPPFPPTYVSYRPPTFVPSHTPVSSRIPTPPPIPPTYVSYRPPTFVPPHMPVSSRIPTPPPIPPTYVSYRPPTFVPPHMPVSSRIPTPPPIPPTYVSYRPPTFVPPHTPVSSRIPTPPPIPPTYVSYRPPTFVPPHTPVSSRIPTPPPFLPPYVLSPSPPPPPPTSIYRQKYH